MQNFWYALHREFLTFDEADHWVIISDIVFVAVLSLIPVMTKWIMSSHSSFAVVNYGVVYLMSTIMMYRPRLAFYLYIALPIISFFAPGPKISTVFVKLFHRKKTHRRAS